MSLQRVQYINLLIGLLNDQNILRTTLDIRFTIAQSLGT